MNSPLFFRDPARFPKRTTVCFVGTGIAGLAGLTEISLRFPDWNIVAFSDRPLLASSSANSYAILGGNGCFSAVNPRSRFRSLMQTSLHHYPRWLNRHVEKGSVSPLNEVHLYNTSCSKSNSALKTLQRLCTEEGNKPNIEKNISRLVGVPLSNAFHAYFKRSTQNGGKRETAAVLSGIAFKCTMLLNPHSLLLQLSDTLAQRGVFFVENARLQSFKTDNDGVSLEMKIASLENHFSINSPHRLKKPSFTFDRRFSTHRINCHTLIIATGHANAQLASQNGLRLKTHSNWGMWLGFSKTQLPNSIQDFCKDLKTSLLIKFNGHSLLLHKEKQGNGIALAIGIVDKKKYWATLPQAQHTAEAKQLWQALFDEKMPIPIAQRSGYRTRSADWLPHIGWLPQARENLSSLKDQDSRQKSNHKNSPPIGVLLVGSFYKSGITMAPIIAEMCAEAVGQKQQQNAMQLDNDPHSLKKFISLLQPTRRDGIRCYNRSLSPFAAGSSAVRFSTDHCLNYPFHHTPPF